MIKHFYRILFDPGQSTCFSETPKNPRILPVMPRIDHHLFTLNALDTDHQVICFRNILIEMESGSLKEQVEHMKSTKLPWSTCVSSGGKSLHFIVSLRQPMPNRMAYARLVKRIYLALGNKIKMDPANKNPARMSRCPGAFRKEQRAHQQLISVLDRVSNTSLERWLRHHEAQAPLSKPSLEEGQLLFFPRQA